MKTIERFEKYLCPPGNGVHTVNTAKDRKEKIHRKIYQTTEDIQSKWAQSLKKLDDHKGAVLLGVTSDCGGGIQRGANWGPLFIRDYLYRDTINVFDIGDIRTIPHLLMDKYLNDQTIRSCRTALYQEAGIELPVSPLSITYDFVEEFYNNTTNKGVVALGGDHSVSFPLTQPLLRKKKNEGKKVAIIHFDAHTDLLDQRLGIDICFGSWAYHILQDLTHPSHLYQIGIRSSGKSEGHWEEKFGVQQYWANEVLKKGANQVAQIIIDDMKRQEIDEIYISFDIDAIDSEYASATGTPEPNGLQPHHAMEMLEIITKNFPLIGADLVEVAPFVSYGQDGLSEEPDSTLTISKSLTELFINKVNENYSK